jgi:hypothetical protein
MDMAATRHPTVLDLGKRKQKDIRQLKKGQGPLLEKVEAAIAAARANVPAGKEIVPVVILYQKKSKGSKKGLAMFGPF